MVCSHGEDYTFEHLRQESQPGSIKFYFSNITDVRNSNKRHKLIDIITVAICAVICSADSWEHIEDFGHSKYYWFKDFLDLPAVFRPMILLAVFRPMILLDVFLPELTLLNFSNLL